MPDIAITDVEAAVAANPWKPWVFVRIETDRGVTGYGEATTMPPEEGLGGVERAREALIGTDPFRTERLFTPHSPVGASATVRSALDIALWDVKARHLDVPLYELLGGSVDGTALRSYANGWYTDVYEDGRRQPELFAEAAREVVARGYDAMKFDPFGSNWRRMDRAELERSIDCVRAVREAVGPRVDLFVEGHKRFSVPMAVEVARKLEPHDPTWFEEPTPHEDNQLKTVAARSPVPVATGESLTSPGDFTDLLHETGVGIVQADVIHVGGITGLEKVAAMAEAENRDVAPHAASGWITLAASLHVDATLPNFMIQENFTEFAFPDWADELVDEPIRTDDGTVHVPDGPGLGIDLDWDAVGAHSLDAHADEIDPIALYDHQWEGRADVDE